LELEEYRQAVESARSNPVGQIPTLDVSMTTTSKAKSTVALKSKPKNALKGTLILKKKKRDSDSEDEQPTEKKVKTDKDKATGSLGLLAAYGDISSSSDDDS
jgi:hypothetical protein